MLSAGRLTRRARQIAAVSVAALAALTFAGPPLVETAVPRAAAAPVPATGAGSDSDRSLTIAPVDPLLSDGEALSVDVRIDNATDQPIEDVTVELLLTSEPISTRYDLSRWFNGEAVLASTVVGSAEVATVEAGESSTVVVTISAESLALTGRPWGAFGLAANAQEFNTATSVVVHDEPGESSPTKLALAAPIDAGRLGGALENGLIPADALEAITSADGQAAVALDAARQAGITVGVDPLIPASTAALGDEAPEAATDWVERADTPDTYPLAYSNADPIAQLRASAYPIEPRNIPRADEPALPASIGLVGERVGVIDATTAVLNAEELPKLAGLGTVVVETSALDEQLTGATPSAPVKIGNETVLAADVELQSLIRAATAPETRTAADSQARVLALLATITRERPSDSRTLAAMLPASSAGEIRPLLEALGRARFVEPIGLDEALKIKPRPVGLAARDDPEREKGAELVRQALSQEESVSQVSSLVEDPSALQATLRLSLLDALPDAGRAVTDADVSAVRGFAGELADLRSAASILDSSVIRATGQSMPLPITLANSLEEPVKVRLTVRPTNALVTVPEPEIEVTIPAVRQQRVQVPIEIVGTGTVIMVAQLYTPDGVPLGEARTIQVQTRPTIEAFVGWTLGTTIALLIGFGIWRSVLKRRRGDTHGDLDERGDQESTAEVTA